MIMPGNQHEAVSPEQLIAASRSLLDALHQAIQHRKWSRVSRLAADYSEQISHLHVDESVSSRTELIQLDIQHRRCMRMLSRQMASVTEDIASLEGGQKTLQRSRAVTDSLLQ
jgi:hypothetical protein